MAKTNKKLFARIGEWLRAMKSELKKVVWPTPKQLVNNTSVVLVSVLVCSVILWGFDRLASGLVQVLINLFG